LFLLAFLLAGNLGRIQHFSSGLKQEFSQATGFVNVKLVTAWDSKNGGAIDEKSITFGSAGSGRKIGLPSLCVADWNPHHRGSCRTNRINALLFLPRSGRKPHRSVSNHESGRDRGFYGRLSGHSSCCAGDYVGGERINSGKFAWNAKAGIAD